jgi:large subunit ribosomal protein L53
VTRPINKFGAGPTLSIQQARNLAPPPNLQRAKRRLRRVRGNDEGVGASGERKSMLKFLSKVVVEYCPLDPRKAAAVELLAQCNGRKAKDSNPACSVELRRLPSPAPSTDLKSQPTLPPPRVLVTYFTGAEEAIVFAEGATAQGIRDQIVARGRLIDTEKMFRDGGEKWPVVIPEEELGMSFPGIKVRHVFPFVLIFPFRRTPGVRGCFFSFYTALNTLWIISLYLMCLLRYPLGILCVLPLCLFRPVM